MEVEKFNTYLDKIDEYAKSVDYLETDITSKTGPDFWYDYFINGVTPENAFNSELQSP